MFYFQQLLNQGLNGIDKTAMITTVVGIGYTILVIGFLIGLYQAALRGGDVQSLAITGIKYLVIAIILAGSNPPPPTGELRCLIVRHRAGAGHNDHIPSCIGCGSG
jgi:hypothetical protein